MQVKGMQAKVHSFDEVLRSHAHATVIKQESITVLEIEKDSLTRKNQFLSDQLMRVKNRDQAHAAVSGIV